MSSLTHRQVPPVRLAAYALLLGLGLVLGGRAHAFATAPLPDFSASGLTITHSVGTGAFSAVGQLDTFNPVAGTPEFIFQPGGFNLMATISGNNDSSPSGSLTLNDGVMNVLTGDLVAFEVDQSTLANPDGATLQFLFTNLGGSKAVDYGGAGGQAVAILTNTGFQLGSADFNTGFSNAGISGTSAGDVVPGVPEPGTLALFGGALGLMAWRRRRNAVA